MFISCKCANFSATIGLQPQGSDEQPQFKPYYEYLEERYVEDTKLEKKELMKLEVSTEKIKYLSKKGIDMKNAFLLNDLMEQFLQTFPKSFIFYSQCIDFFKKAIGPVYDLRINELRQRYLFYGFTLDVTKSKNSSGAQSLWQFSVCSNCNLVLCAKCISSDTPKFFISRSLQTKHEEWSKKMYDKSYSHAFDLLVMNHPKCEVSFNNHNQSDNYNLTIGSSSAIQHLDSKQLRLRHLQINFHRRLEREIADTNDRIQRYTSEQFALLKSFRKKSEQEYQLLVSLLQSIPDQQVNDWLDREPPVLDVGISNNDSTLFYGGAQNMISNRHELNATVTPTAIQPPNNILVNKGYLQNSVAAPQISPKSAIMTTATLDNSILSPTRVPPILAITSSIEPAVVGKRSTLNSKTLSFDTPPATPASLLTSPAFRQQQQLTTLANTEESCQKELTSSTADIDDDCLFELEGVDSSNVATSQQQQHNRAPYFVVANRTQNPYESYNDGFNDTNRKQKYHISDLDESDNAEEAEDALDLNNSRPIATPHRSINSTNVGQVSTFAKSLPIEISNSPQTLGRGFSNTLESEDELDNNVDIAASIKALAQSVHGEAVFGDLPRPRFRSQI